MPSLFDATLNALPCCLCDLCVSPQNAGTLARATKIRKTQRLLNGPVACWAPAASNCMPAGMLASRELGKLRQLTVILKCETGLWVASKSSQYLECS